MSSTPIYVYAASPYGFTESTRDFMTSRWYPVIRQAHPHLILLDPWDSPVAPRPLMASGRQNLDLIHQAHFLVAGLDGPDVDSGTAAEIGYATAIGRPVIGFRQDLRQANDHPNGTINLQVEYFIRTRGTIVSTLDALQSAIRSLAGQILSAHWTIMAQPIPPELSPSHSL